MIFIRLRLIATILTALASYESYKVGNSFAALAFCFASILWLLAALLSIDY